MHKMNEEAFNTEFPNLFDVSHGNTFQMITIQEDRDFLLAQREPGRRGCMAGLDRKLKKTKHGKTTQTKQIKKQKKLQMKRTKKVVLESSSSVPEDDLKSEEGIANHYHLISELHHFKNVAGRTSLHQRFLVRWTNVRLVTDMQSSP